MAESTQRAALVKQRILLLEDNSAIRHLITVILRRRYKVEAMALEDSEQAILEVIRDVQPRVVLIGLPLASRAVFATICRIKSALPDLMLVGLTMLQGEPYLRMALSVGFTEVIAKNALASELMPILEGMIEGDLGRQVVPESNVTRSMLR